MNDSCVFCKIIKKEIPAKIEMENEHCLVFHDINPRAKIHLLVIPKKHIATINDVVPEDVTILGNMLLAAKEAAARMNMSSYRLLISTGKEAGQEVFHVHMHVMSPS